MNGKISRIDFVIELKDYLAKNEPEKALDSLRSYSENIKDSKLESKVIEQYARFNKIKNDFDSGIINVSTHSSGLLIVTRALINIIQDLEEKDSNNQNLILSPVFSELNKREIAAILIILILTVSVMFASLFFDDKPSKQNDFYKTRVVPSVSNKLDITNKPTEEVKNISDSSSNKTHIRPDRLYIDSQVIDIDSPVIERPKPIPPYKITPPTIGHFEKKLIIPLNQVQTSSNEHEETIDLYYVIKFKLFSKKTEYDIKCPKTMKVGKLKEIIIDHFDIYQIMFDIHTPFDDLWLEHEYKKLTDESKTLEEAGLRNGSVIVICPTHDEPVKPR